MVAADAAGVWGTPPTGGTGSFTPLRGYTSSVTASPCHHPLEGKAFFARGRFFWLCLSLFVCLSLFGGAGQAGQRQERQGGVEGYAGVGGLGAALGVGGLGVGGGLVVVIAAGLGFSSHLASRCRGRVTGVLKSHAAEPSVPASYQY